ncbi:MAG: membrane protein YdbS with pleckstrin-like domain [Polaribacter sp.]|jgi:membrane protein YdbS with pleckstrin-like domain
MIKDQTNSEIIADVTTSQHDIIFGELSDSLPKISAITSFLSWMIPVFIVSLVRFFKPSESLEVELLNFVIIGLLLISFLSSTYSYYFAKSCGYLKREFDVYHKQGIWWRKQTALSFSRIQHIDLSSDPLERKYGMATLKFFTAGGASSDLKIHGLPLDTAEELRHQILKLTENE